MTSAGVVRQQAFDRILQRGEGRPSEGALNRCVVQTNLLLEPAEDREFIHLDLFIWIFNIQVLLLQLNTGQLTLGSRLTLTSLGHRAKSS